MKKLSRILPLVTVVLACDSEPEALDPVAVDLSETQVLFTTEGEKGIAAIWSLDSEDALLDVSFYDDLGEDSIVDSLEVVDGKYISFLVAPTYGGRKQMLLNTQSGEYLDITEFGPIDSNLQLDLTGNLYFIREKDTNNEEVNVVTRLSLNEAGGPRAEELSAPDELVRSFNIDGEGNLLYRFEDSDGFSTRRRAQSSNGDESVDLSLLDAQTGTSFRGPDDRLYLETDRKVQLLSFDPVMTTDFLDAPLPEDRCSIGAWVTLKSEMTLFPGVCSVTNSSIIIDHATQTQRQWSHAEERVDEFIRIDVSDEFFYLHFKTTEGEDVLVQLDPLTAESKVLISADFSDRFVELQSFIVTPNDVVYFQIKDLETRELLLGRLSEGSEPVIFDTEIETAVSFLPFKGF